MLVQPTGILPEDYQDYKKKQKNWDSVGFYKKTREKILGFHRKTFFWILIFFTSDSKFFSWDSGILDQKKYDFCDICDPEMKFHAKSGNLKLHWEQWEQ